MRAKLTVSMAAATVPMSNAPLQLGSAEDFAALRNFLVRSEYTEASLNARLELANYANFGSSSSQPPGTEALSTPLDCLIRLFLECKPIAAADAQSLLGEPAVACMSRLGLLRINGREFESTVGLCPTNGLYLVNDRGGDLESLPEDVVYPAILENTQSFLKMLPDTPCERFLDLGAGTGVAALIAASRYAAHAWATDIAPRSAHFSEFNSRLNGLANVSVGCGDLFEPVVGRKFDRVVTHPPYVPVFKPTCIFRDGGDDGEQIVRRAIEGLPEILAPGGRFYAQTLLSDREGEHVEERVRRWLGPSHEEFDVAVFAETAREPSDFVGRAMQKGTHRLEELSYWNSIFRQLKVRFLVYGCVMVQRHAIPAPCFTVRTMRGPATGRTETEWAIDFHTAASREGWVELVMGSEIRLSPYLHLAVLHRVADGDLVPQQFLLRTRHPFECEIRCPGWVAALVQNCDGKRTGQHLMEVLQAMQVVSSETPAAEFAAVLKTLIGAGFMDVPEHRIPDSAQKNDSGPRIG